MSENQEISGEVVLDAVPFVLNVMPFALDVSEIQLAIPINEDPIVETSNNTGRKKLCRFTRNSLRMFYNVFIADVIPFDTKGKLKCISIPIAEFIYQKGYQYRINGVPFNTSIYSKEYQTLRAREPSRYLILE